MEEKSLMQSIRNINTKKIGWIEVLYFNLKRERETLFTKHNRHTRLRKMSSKTFYTNLEGCSQQVQVIAVKWYIKLCFVLPAPWVGTEKLSQINIFI